MEHNTPAITVTSEGELVRHVKIKMNNPSMSWGVDTGFKEPDHLFIEFEQDKSEMRFWLGDEESVNQFIESLEEHKERLD